MKTIAVLMAVMMFVLMACQGDRGEVGPPAACVDRVCGWE